MILETALGMSLFVNVSLDSGMPDTGNRNAWTQLSVRQKDATLLPLVRRATDCIVQAVAANPRYTDGLRPTDVNDLIVDSIAACAKPVRMMIEAHDRMYGTGSGEAFLLGPYLDVLPAAVVKQVRVKPASSR